MILIFLLAIRAIVRLPAQQDDLLLQLQLWTAVVLLGSSSTQNHKLHMSLQLQAIASSSHIALLLTIQISVHGHDRCSLC